MGLTKAAVGRGALDTGLLSRMEGETVIALAGNPNVGKSTLFNALTGLHQHTGNWPGKTVASAQGLWKTPDHRWQLVDIPGTYSLAANSAEEEVARDFLCFGHPDGVVVVCDATCLQRNLNLVLQIRETGLPTVVCVNLMDEATRRSISLDLPLLERRLGVPVVATVARKHSRQSALEEAVTVMLTDPRPRPAPVSYPAAVENAVARLQPLVQRHTPRPSSRWLSLRLLEGRLILPDMPPELTAAVAEQQARLTEAGYSPEALPDILTTAVTATAARLCRGVVRYGKDARQTDRKIDRVLTGRLVGYPLMLLLLLGVLWLTMVGANAPSRWLSAAFSWGEEQLTLLFTSLNAPLWLHGALVEGAYRVLAWVVSVMLPPMAIFFPLFTLLEDVGYLPRIAYTLDRPFARCGSCGKQALTMCMGFGCNAAGVVGCRIIQSPRERLLAVLTNSLVPCNGRFPTLITLITLFFIGTATGISSLWASLLLTGLILLGVLATLGITRLLAATVLRGTPSAFVLEMPPYRPPQVGQVILRTVIDRTLFVLGRAAAVAAPAGLLIWVLANVSVGNASLLTHAATLLEPAGRLLGLDGAILLAFILGFPANEIVLPLILMIYLAQGNLTDTASLTEIHRILLDNGWTAHTALCTMLFSLFHWPCSTTLLTIRKETGSWRWTALAALLPTALGAGLCILLTALAGR
ncbi:MAG: ferrous iron transport protein B [Clostridia bacterium]|nr:ferrous iron transport protein B [Clostridia bacterium]